MADFIGKGYAYPLQLGGDGKFKVVTGDDKVKASIAAILDTPVGTRYMLRDFGCRIHELNFENDTTVTATLAEFFVREALERWEKRITIPDDGIIIVFEDDIMWIDITYTLNETNSEENMVYPYYIQEAA